MTPGLVISAVCGSEHTAKQVSTAVMNPVLVLSGKPACSLVTRTAHVYNYRCSMAAGRDANGCEVFCICSANDLPSPGHEGTNGKRYDVKMDLCVWDANVLHLSENTV